MVKQQRNHKMYVPIIFYKLVTLLISLTLLSACNNDTENIKSGGEADQTPTFSLEKQETVTLESDEVSFGRLRQQFVNSYEDEYWAFHDYTKQQLLVFTSSGKFVAAIGSRGSGPAEFQNVYGYNFSEENTVWAFDENLNAFKHFSLEDSLLATVDGIYGDGFLQSHFQLFINSDKIYIPVTETEYSTQDFSQVWKSALIAVYNFKGEFLYTIGTLGEPAQDPFTYNVRAMLDIDFGSETVLASYTTSHKLGEYKFNTSAHDYFGKKSPAFKIPEEETRASDTVNEILKKGLNRSAPMASYITDDYYLFHFQNLSQEWYESKDPNAKSHYLVIYDRNSKEFKGEIELPYALGNIAPNGEIRLIESINPDKYTISKYNLFYSSNK